MARTQAPRPVSCTIGQPMFKHSGFFQECAHIMGCGLALASMLVTAKAGDNWPQFRGPNAGGVDSSKAAPATWDIAKQQNVLWRTAVPGLSHASPIIWGDRVYVATAVKPGEAELKVGLYGDIEPLEENDSHQWRLIAFDKATGKIVWNSLACEGKPRSKRHPKASQCNSTPATDGKHIIAMLASEGLFCFDMNGKQEWRKDMGPLDSGYYVVPTAQWGYGSSPIIHEGKVILVCDVQTNSFITALDIKDGKEVWRTARKDVPTWGSPTIVETAARKQIVINGWHETAGYDLGSGKQLWHMDGGGDIPVPTPVFSHDLIYLTSAHGKFRPLRAIRPDASGDITPADPGQTNSAIAWAHARQGNYMQTPIVVGDLLFACLDMGLVTCADARTGAIKYNQRLGNGSAGFTSSPVSDGRNLFFASEPGKVFVVPASETFSVVATNDLGEACMSSPAIVDGTLFYRTQRSLIAIANSAK